MALSEAEGIASNLTHAESVKLLSPFKKVTSPNST
jgi:hypothetical protein